MSEENKIEAQNLPTPICPHCKDDPLMPIARQFGMGPYALLIVMCSKCRNVVPAFVLAERKPQIVRAPANSPLIKLQ